MPKRPRAKPKGHNERVSVKLAPDLHRRLVAEADRRMCGLGYLVDRAVTRWLDAREGDPEL